MSVPRIVRFHLAGLAVAAVGLLPAAASAAPGPIKGDGSGQCITIPGDTTELATEVVIEPCTGASGQGWELTPAGELRSLDGARCLDAARARTVKYTRVISYTCHGGANQRWTYRASDRSIRGVQSGLCLDVRGARIYPGTGLQLYTCFGGSGQKWSEPAPAGDDVTAPTPPGAPTVSALTCRSATLTWTASTDAAGVAFYDIYHDGQLMKSVSGESLSTSVDANAGAKWGFYVNARDAAGNVSQASETTPATIPQCTVDTAAPSAPTDLAGTVSGTAVALRWTASTDDVGVAAYDLYRGDTKVGSTSGTTLTDSGLTPGEDYEYVVVARDAQDNASDRSTAVTITAGAACTTAVCSTTELASDTDLPWDIATLADGTAIYTRRDAHDLVQIDVATGEQKNLGAIPNVESTNGEGGLMGIAVTPQFPASDPWIYLMHTSPTDNRVVRVKLAGGQVDASSVQVLISGIGRNKYHDGGRLRFGPDGKLYVATGDAQNTALPQNVNSLNGKILRINADGSIPSDNPFGNAVWSLGHRNPQGLAWDSQGRLWQQEFGNILFDETNVVEKGGNYGWPNCEGTASLGGGGCSTPGYTAPKYTYPVAQGSCSGIAIVRDVLYVGCLRGARVYRHVLSGATIASTTQLFGGAYGRIRALEPTRDGGLLLTTSNDNGADKIVKIGLGS